MNDLLLAQEVAALLKDPAGPYDLADAIPHIQAAQDAADIARPTLTLQGGEWKHYGATRRIGTLTVELRGRAGNETQDVEHQQRFDAVYDAFLGEIGSDAAESETSRTQAKAAFKAAILARGAVEILDYGPDPENTLEYDVDGEDLRTVLKLNVVWRFLPV